MKEMKEIKDINIFEIRAEKHIICGPPALWELEASMDVCFKDGTSTVQYLQICDLEELSWQVTSRRLNEIPEEESLEPYLIASWGEEEQQSALKSPYGKAIRQLNGIFKKIAIL